MSASVALRRGHGEERAALPAGVEPERIAPAESGEDAAPAADRLRRALHAPLGFDASRAVAPGATVLVAVPDATRPAWLPTLLPVLLDELERQGIERRRVQLAIANGAHRTPTREEAGRWLGEVAARQVVHLHDAVRGPHIQVGRTARGTPVELDDALREAEAVITVGPVAFHYFAGFGGGPKLVFPGLASRRAAESNHSLSLTPEGSEGPLHPGCTAGNLEGNPVASDLREAAAMAPADFAVSWVEGSAGPGPMWAGDPHSAQRAAERWLLEHGSVGTASGYDVVIASAGGAPHDVNWIQSHKALVHACRYARPGAEVVLVAECEEGVGSPSFEQAIQEPAERLLDRMRERFALNGQTALSTRWHAERFRVTLVSGLASQGASRWGFRVVSRLDEALRGLAGTPGSRVAWLPHPTAVIPGSAAPSP